MNVTFLNMGEMKEILSNNWIIGYFVVSGYLIYHDNDYHDISENDSEKKIGDPPGAPNSENQKIGAITPGS